MLADHATRALVLHATPMGDNCVSACEGTATTVLVCRTISPFRPSHLNNWVYMAIFERRFSCARCSWPSLYFDLANSANLSDPAHSLIMVNCAMMHGLVISLPESTLVQSPLRLSACAHTHIHTRIGMRAGSDARLAAARGSGRCSRWTRYQHGCGSYCRTSATRGVGSYSDFQVWGKLG